VADATTYQNNARLHYMTTSEIRESFTHEVTTTSATEAEKQ
jgi:hypothetical protein